jgi:hypothetical protein
MIGFKKFQDISTTAAMTSATVMTGASHHLRNLDARYCIMSATLLRARSIAVFLNLTLLMANVADEPWDCINSAELDITGDKNFIPFSWPVAIRKPVISSTTSDRILYSRVVVNLQLAAAGVIVF